MKVLIGCEFSGVVRDAFIEQGHDAISCDLLPTESPGPHFQGDIKCFINTEKWDLVVGNPPHSGTSQLFPRWGEPITYMDEDWHIHRKFYRDIHSFIKKYNDIIILENHRLSSEATFLPMIRENSLQHIGTFEIPNTKFYYIWSKMPTDRIKDTNRPT